MITVVQGRVGNGKSYEMTRRAIEHMKSGGVVATNMEIHLDKVRSIHRRRIASWQLLKLEAASDPREIPVGDLRGRGRRRVLVILDEALNWFESSATALDPRRAIWGQWLRQSDKLGQDVVFIAQEFARTAKWIRELAQVADDIRNYGQIRAFGCPVGKWLHLDRVYCCVHADVRTKMVLGFDVHVTGPSVWDCYETATLYGFEHSKSAFIASVPPPYHAPFLRLIVIPLSWLAVRLFWESLP